MIVLFPFMLPMGKFLRKTKINELPQLANIFIGQMSFVGPRPQARRHYELYSRGVRDAIDHVPPGLTGIGSVVFRDEEAILDEVPGDRDHFHDTIVAPYKGELEVWWTNHRTLGNYFLLMFLTGWALVNPRTKVWKKWFKNLPEPPKELEKYL